jgi:hypothetical protein
MRMVLSKSPLRRRESSGYAFSGTQHLFQAGVFLQQTQSGVFHQALGVGPGFGSDLGKLRFLLRGEMNFHGSDYGKTKWEATLEQTGW